MGLGRRVLSWFATGNLLVSFNEGNELTVVQEHADAIVLSRSHASCAIFPLQFVIGCRFTVETGRKH